MNNNAISDTEISQCMRSRAFEAQVGRTEPERDLHSRGMRPDPVATYLFIFTRCGVTDYLRYYGDIIRLNSRTCTAKGENRYQAAFKSHERPYIYKVQTNSNSYLSFDRERWSGQLLNGQPLSVAN